MRVDAPENTGSCARNRNPRAGAHRLGAGAEAGAHRLWQGLGRADPGRPLGGLPPSGRRREGPLGDTVCAAGGAPDISLRGPRRNVSITRAARTAAAFLSPPGSPAAGPSSQPLRAAAQALCANVTFPRAPPPPGRRAPGCQERGAARRARSWKAARSSAALTENPTPGRTAGPAWFPPGASAPRWPRSCSLFPGGPALPPRG